MSRYFTLIACVGLFLGVSELHAQRIPGYSQRQTVSPYVNLFNNRAGGVNNYFQFVRPLQQQQRTNQLQTVQNQYLQQQLLQNQGFAVGGAPGAAPISLGFGQPIGGMLRPGSMGVGAPKTSATYFNYSHFYYNNPANLIQQPRVGRRAQ